MVADVTPLRYPISVLQPFFPKRLTWYLRPVEKYLVVGPLSQMRPQLHEKFECTAFPNAWCHFSERYLATSQPE